MTLQKTSCVVKVGKELSDPFDTVRGFRQGDPLSCTFFNFIMESIVRKSGVQRTGTIKTKSVQLLAYADDIDIIGHGLRDVTAAFAAIERESAKVGLAVNEGKTKYMLSKGRENTRPIGTHITSGDYNFEVVDEFVYLGPQ